jgi:hypothetical protein
MAWGSGSGWGGDSRWRPAAPARPTTTAGGGGSRPTMNPVDHGPLRPRPDNGQGGSAGEPIRPLNPYRPGVGRPADGAAGMSSGGGGGGGVAAPPENSVDQATAQALVNLILGEYGLPELTAFVMGLVTNGITDPTLLRALIEDTQAFKDRFPAMEIRRQQGFNRISAREYIDFENYAATLFAEWGLPPTFYDQRADFTDLIAGSADINQGRQNLAVRVQSAFAVVAAAPTETRDWFSSVFGVGNGDAALASYVLDKDRSIVALQEQVGMAQIGGAGAQYGFNFGLERARQLRDRGITEGQARQGFGQVQDLNPLLTESISEHTDFTAENEGFGAVFRLDDLSAQRLERRIQQRRAAFSGGGGYERSQGGGLVGLGTGR